MTPAVQPSAPDEHPEASELAEFAEGLLPPARADEVRTHLDACPACRDVRESLEGISGLLGAVPDPSPMPAEVAARIDAALAAEAHHDAGVSRETGAAATPPTPAPAHTVSRETPKPASHRRSAGHARGATRPPSHGRSPRRWGRALLGTAAAASLVGLGFLMTQLPNSNGDGDAASGLSQDSASQPEEKAEAAPEGGLTDASLESRVRGMLSATEAQGREGTDREGSPGSAASSDSPLAGGGGSQVPSCVREAVSRSEAPLAAETDTYEGTPVYIVVLPHAGNPDRVDTYVVDSSCTAKRSATGDILLQKTFARP